MKKRLIFLALFLSAHIAPSQTLLNPDFEQPDTAFASGLHGWRANRQYETGRDSQIRYAGRSSVYLKSIPGKTFGAFSQMVAIPKSTVVRKFRVSGHIKREAVEQYTGVWINVFEGDNSLFFDNMYARNLNGTADWTEVATEFFVEETANEIQIGGLLVGQGQVWFDSFAITEIPIGAEQVPDSLRSYLAEALDLIQQNALHRDSVKWPKVRERALLMISGQTTYAGCYATIRYALGKLKDNHSFLMAATASSQWSQPDAEAFRKMPLTTGEMLDDKIACLKMPAVSSGSEALNTWFADQLHKLLDSLDRMQPQGWILDLRDNGGGNCWPMLAGIGPLLGEGICGYFAVPGGAKPEAWFYRKGAAGIGKSAITKVSRKPYKLRQKQAPVAVLTGPRTGSSGEVVTVAFRKRPNTRSFGEPTAGLSTGNANYSLRDGAQIFLATSIYADREGVPYGSKIVPDEPVAPQAAAEGKDAALEAAKKWLIGQKK